MSATTLLLPPAFAGVSERTPGALLSSDDYGSSVERTATLHPLSASAVVCLDQGVVSRPRALYSRGVALVLVGGPRGERVLPRARSQIAYRGIDQDGRAAGAEPRPMPRRRGGGLVSVPGRRPPSGLRGSAGELRGRH